MSFLTLGLAAKATGKQKSTILDAIRAGRLSATRNDLQQWQIDPAELFRVYPAQHVIERQETPEQQTEHPASFVQMLEKEREERERERRQLESQIDDLKADRDRWQQQAERITLLLTHQPQPATTAETARPGFWRRLFGSR